MKRTVYRRISYSLALSLVALLVWSSVHAGAPTKPSATTQPAKSIKINLDAATAVTMPEVTADLKPVSFTTPDGKEGWAVRLPGNRPIATPAYAGGLIFVGGGYGSHEFYALDAKAGTVAWQMKTSDDGPTAAVVEDGCVAFNTESCTIVVADAKTGKVIWQEWLGDPLMSQPAISQGKLFMAYPGGNPRGVQRGDGSKPQPPTKAGPAKGNGHRLLCADLKTGEHLWEQDITSDVISAPVLANDQVVFVCFDGTSFCLKAKNGEIVWKKQNAGTSAPLVADGQVIMTQRENKGKDIQEGVKRVELKGGAEKDKQLLAAGKAEYFKRGNEGNTGLSMGVQKAQDGSVGFAGGAPAMAQMSKAMGNVNIGTVAGAWSYQGSRAAYGKGRIMNAQGNRLNSIGSKKGDVAWSAEATGKGIDANAQVFSPPALGKDNMYLCSVTGHVVALDQKSGKSVFTYALNRPVAFQPALAGGNVYLGTTNGMVICLKTGQPDADGWYAWGGNAQHNKSE